MCATFINHGERLIKPSSHYMHSPIIAVNDLTSVNFTTQLQSDQVHTSSAITILCGAFGVAWPVLSAKRFRLLLWHDSTSRNGTLRMVQSVGRWWLVGVYV